MASGRTKTQDFFVWTDDEVGLLLDVALNYKTTKWQENVDWESCQSKYADILGDFVQQYPASTTAGGKDFPHHKYGITKSQVTSKLKAIRAKYRKAVDTGRRSGHGRVVYIFFDKCEQIWGGSPATNALEAGIESEDMLSSSEGPSTSSRCSTPAAQMPPVLDPVPSPDDENVSFQLPPEVVGRRDMLQTRLLNNRRNRLKHKLHGDPAVQEDLILKKRMVDLLEESERRTSERLDRITDNIATITKTITDVLHHMMMQPNPFPFAGSSFMRRKADLQLLPTDKENVETIKKEESSSPHQEDVKPPHIIKEEESSSPHQEDVKPPHIIKEEEMELTIPQLDPELDLPPLTDIKTEDSSDTDDSEEWK
ncbi:uncharacterized protein LOC115410605 [Sphaeramia orbicularis]|uniref:uncharacterized protein LOC115410605 n=1 Tax=Sphaeramia orbicularis TaxID=375764 RepID=UPI001180B6EB|nr:uncharacterized protein LOC115410605 [Sphaeramia orbicularis]